MAQMQLNTIKPAKGAKRSPKRVGRGIGSGLGKTCGSGHKGQHSRSGGYHKVGFEGGQMPLQRRLPKFGFNSYLARITAKLRLHELAKVDSAKIDNDVITIQVLKDAGVINKNIKRVRVFASGKLTKAVKLKGIAVTKGARAAIEEAGGQVE